MKPASIKGRGVASNEASRFLDTRSEAVDDGWFPDPDEDGRPATRVYVDSSQSIIAHNDSPDIPFQQSINPYRGCEHGCSYCYARPTHAWLDLSPGLDAPMPALDHGRFRRPQHAAQMEMF